ncbi:MAG: signal peptide peptidase SppA [Rubrivivax sp.]|nr:signal peptide peptidase SppA [Rubrivivax sp.]
MPADRRSLLGRLLRPLATAAGALWSALDFTRRALLNLLLLALLVAAAWLWWKSSPPPLQPKTALVIDLAGPVLEQRVGDTSPLERLRRLGRAGEQASGPWRLRDVLAALDAAARDERIAHAVLLLDDFGGAGLPVLREIAAALQRFKAAGKPVYAWGSAFDQRSYYLAAHATEVWLHPMGGVLIAGYGRQRNYYRELFDKVGVQAHVLRVGQFKNAAEIYSDRGPSPATLQAEGALYDDLWATWQQGVEAARGLDAGHIARGIEALPGSLAAAGGSAARLALDSRLVDALRTRDEMRQRLIELGEPLAEGKTFRQVSLAGYLRHVEPRRDGDAVAVIVAQGPIGDGRAGPGRIGGLSTGELVRRAREDDRIKAVVLRVDSPGGSAFGSELVRHELALTRRAGKPVVVSMGSVAASGGYWISMAADEVIADAATITGSIGVVALLPSAKQALDRAGIHTGGHTTSWLVGAFDPRREPDPRFLTLVQTAIDRVYADFTGLVAGQRKTTAEAVHTVAQGRVWTGRQALEHGLVDRNGSFGDALASAAQRAGLPADARVVYLEEAASRWQRLLDLLQAGVAGALADGLADALAQALAGASGGGAGAVAPAPGAAALLQAGPLPAIADDLGWLADITTRRRPYDAVVHCLCEAP